ncbi:hypothetical protein like AT4G26485 [Hibiscus trionum]|uniref:25S rRNA (uridine-N(3))-methyltransferase BMT5-like domain-containing protein n=1 Tax=Hibiscus trionum TaxID=183268 RepID=A0A9W7JEZ3_HIBTR|nr:hypothetical protein like AT4G26485 [Hibiscus trionum]
MELNFDLLSLGTNNAEKRIKHYSSSHKILLVGEGDFSFAACLGRFLSPGANLVATSLDSKETLQIKYSGATANLIRLEELGCTIIHGVDCRSMSQHKDLRFNFFDRIVYNFPHAGFFFCREDTSFVIELHKELVRGFLRNAVQMLTENGEVHITHKTSHPFSRWGIVELANEAGLRLSAEVPFWTWDYPGYRNKRGSGNRPDESFPVGACSTFKFKRGSGNRPDESCPVMELLLVSEQVMLTNM